MTPKIPPPIERELVLPDGPLPASFADLPYSGRWRPRQFVRGRYPQPEPWRSTVLRSEVER